MRIFLDVGANTGQTLAAVRDLGFDLIYCFEPATICLKSLAHLAHSRVSIEAFGLSNVTREATLYDPGRPGAGLWVKDAPRKHPGEPIPEERIQLRRASAWFKRHIDERDRVWMKLNCEGSECDILDDLIGADEFRKVEFAMIDFDARKISALHERMAATQRLLAEYPAPRVMTSRDAMIGPTHTARIRNWLRLTGFKL